MKKQDYHTLLLRHLRCEVFFHGTDINEMMEGCRQLSDDMQETTQDISEIEIFMEDIDWADQLQDNKRLARKLLDAIKLYERPLMQLETQEQHTDINVGVRNMIMKFNKQLTALRDSEKATAARRLSHAVTAISYKKL